METAIIALSIMCVYFLYRNITMAYKIGYYEQTFLSHKDKFTEDRYKHIEEVMNKKTPF